MNKNDSSDLEDITPKQSERDPSKADENSTKPTANDLASQNLYKKVSQRKQIIQKTIAQNYNRKSESVSKNSQSSYGQNPQTTRNQPLEINTNKTEINGPLVELPPHLQKIMQVRSTTNKTSSMARQ